MQPLISEARSAGGWGARFVGMLVVTAVMLCAWPASAQKSVADLFGRPATPEGQARTFLEELMLFGYVENSFVGNLRGAGRSNRNELRFYDLDANYTFNMAELSVKKDPSDRYPFGVGLVLTAGEDAQKNHALGIFRDEEDAFPFRNTEKFDLQEAYLSYRVPLGGGLTLKGGKFVTLLGYEVIEGPNNLNFSRGNLFIYSSPLTHVGALLTYGVTDWLSLTAGPVVGWDVAQDNNDAMSVMGQVAVTPIKDLTTSLNWITGPEQNDNDHPARTVLDLVVNYTGIKRLTLGLNVDYGWEDREASLVAAATRQNNDASWWGWAAYAAYDWTDKLRTALRVGFFDDTDGVRTLAVAPAARVELYDVTATLQYKIWRGLVGRLEYRHDEASRRVFKIETPGPAPTSRAQDTLTLALHYLFF
jgi:hypothetical protein